MRVNDLVFPKNSTDESRLSETHPGVVIETIERHPDCTVFCLVEWDHNSQWWNANELELVEEQTCPRD